MGRNRTTRRVALGAVALLCAGCQSSSGWQVAEDSEWREGEPPPAPFEAPVVGAESAHELETVYFAFDAWNLGEDARKALRQNAKEIGENPEWGKLTVEGHCDERGSEEYNVALGQRRAQNVANYLRDLGIPAERLHTVSYGEARPAVEGFTETAWRWNRRSVFRSADVTAAR